MALFHSSKPTKILAGLSNGHIIECRTFLKAYGNYREWYEPAPVEWMYGWTESDQEIDQETIEVLYPDEFDTDFDIPEGILINSIIEILEDIDWEVQEGWEDDYEPDWDAIAKEQRHLAA